MKLTQQLIDTIESESILQESLDLAARNDIELRDIERVLTGRSPGFDPKESFSENVFRHLRYLDDQLVIARLGVLED